MKAERTLFPQVGEQIVQIRLHADSASTMNGILPEATVKQAPRELSHGGEEKNKKNGKKERKEE